MELKYYILHEDDESSMFVLKNLLSLVCRITSTVVQVVLTYGASHRTNHNTSCLCL